MSGDVDKVELLRELGYGAALERGLQLLVDAGLTTPRKARIALSKRGDIEQLLQAKLLRSCASGDCKAEAQAMAGDRVVVTGVEPGRCEVCGGSATDRAFEELRTACARAGWARLCIVGGSPNARERLRSYGAPPQLRLIDGVLARTRTEAAADLKWADLVVVWGSTQLQHSVSNLYTGARHCTTVQRRGVKELCRHVARLASQGA